MKNGKRTNKNYISDVAILTQDEETGFTLAFTHRDRLGSAATFTDHNNQVTARRHFDPFGKPRGGDWSQLENLTLAATLGNNPLDGNMETRRGFTDHEHLDEAEIIHMNGRVYDYNVGRFMSVDPVIQSPENSQSINPYSYIMNNPLSGTDPSGYSSCPQGQECPKGAGTETVKVSKDAQVYQDADGNNYVDAGDGSGDLIQIESIEVTKSNGASATVNYGSGGTVTGGSLTATSGTTVNFTDIGGQQTLAVSHQNQASQPSLQEQPTLSDLFAPSPLQTFVFDNFINPIPDIEASINAMLEGNYIGALEAMTGIVGKKIKGVKRVGNKVDEFFEQHFDDYNQARNAALEWLEKREFKAEAPNKGKFGASKNKPNGMRTADGSSGFRVEFDERSGAHINVWSDKEKGPHFMFNAPEKTVEKINRRFQGKE